MIHQFQCLSCGGFYGESTGDGNPYHHACPPLPPNKHGVVRERPDKRDENLIPPPARGAFRTRDIKAEGRGVKCLTAQADRPPAWLEQLRARIEREAQ